MIRVKEKTLRETKISLVKDLIAAGIDRNEAAKEAQIVLEQLTGLSNTQQLIQSDLLLETPLLAQVETIALRRKKREPLQYCLGSAWFMDLEFYVEPGIFIPRTDTETVVNIAIKFIDEVERVKGSAVNLAEVGIGSGAISVALLKLNPLLCITACDVSDKAIAIARHNAAKHGVANRLKLISGDWQEVLPASFDGIVSNPPYIPRSQRGNLLPEIASWEPEVALYGADDGLVFFNDFAHYAKRLISFANGFLVTEIGDGQAEAVDRIFSTASWREIALHSDINQLARVVSATVPTQ